MIIERGTVSDETRLMLLNLLQDIYGSAVKISNITILNQHVDYAALLVSINHPNLRLISQPSNFHLPLFLFGNGQRHALGSDRVPFCP